MAKKIIYILLSLFFVLFSLNIFADDQSVSAVLLRQSKQIKNLTSRVSQLENVILELRRENNVSKDTNVENVQESPEGVDSLLPTSVSDLSGSKISKEKQEYDAALVVLKEGKLELAEQNFAKFINDYPNSELHSNAIFWYGEAFFRQKKYNKAAVNFLKCYKDYPKGVKAADALLKVSLALNELNKNEEACNMLDKLDSEFPDRPAGSINRAKEARVKFGCGQSKK